MIRRLTTLTTLIALLTLTACSGHAPERSSASEEKRLAPKEVKKEAELDDASADDHSLKVRGDAAGGGMKAELTHEETPAAPSPNQVSPPPRDAPAESVQAAESEGGVDVEGDTWEAADPRAELDELVKDLSEQLDEASRDGITQNQPPGALRCEEVCDLSEGVCTSSEKICRIAQRHPAEPYFADRCAWSGRECTQASERCRRCAPR